jgi:hypothetical protein
MNKKTYTLATFILIPALLASNLQAQVLGSNSITELHNLQQSLNNQYIVSGSYNQSIDFATIRDTTRAFNSGFIIRLDSVNSLVKYNRFDAMGYSRIIKCLDMPNGGIGGLLLFNKGLNYGNKQLLHSKNWGLAYFFGSDSMKFVLVDSANNYDLLDFYTGRDTTFVIFKKLGESTAHCITLASSSGNIISSFKLYSAPDNTDYLHSEFVNESNFYVAERSVKTKLKFFRRTGICWEQTTFDISEYRFINSVAENSNVEIFLQRADSIFILKLNLDDFNTQATPVFQFSGDLINLKSKTFQSTKYYFGSATSFVSQGNTTIEFQGNSNSFIIIDFENDGVLDTIVNIGLVNIKDILIKYLENTSYAAQVQISDLMELEVNETLFCNAIDNLIRNGLKYNNSNEKLVKIYAEGNYIIVEDNGIGMSNKQFEKAIKAENKENSNGEIGLGLGISNAILKEHGFSFICEKSEGQGSSIKINIKK